MDNVHGYLSAYGKPPHQALGELFTNFGFLGASSGHLRGVSGRLGSVMGRLGGVLGTSWEPLGTSWELIGGVLGRLGRQNRLGALLEPFWSRPGSVLEASWGRLGASWKRLGQQSCIPATAPSSKMMEHQSIKVTRSC